MKHLLAVMALCLPLSAAAELAGSWTLSIDTPRGVQNPKLVVEHSDSGYSGTYHSLRSPVDVNNIQTDGTTFSFELVITVPIGDIDVAYVGTIDGDNMTGSVRNPRGEVPFSGTRDQ